MLKCYEQSCPGLLLIHVVVVCMVQSSSELILVRYHNMGTPRTTRQKRKATRVTRYCTQEKKFMIHIIFKNSKQECLEDGMMPSNLATLLRHSWRSRYLGIVPRTLWYYDDFREFSYCSLFHRSLIILYKIFFIVGYHTIPQSLRFSWRQTTYTIPCNNGGILRQKRGVRRLLPLQHKTIQYRILIWIKLSLNHCLPDTILNFRLR